MTENGPPDQLKTDFINKALKIYKKSPFKYKAIEFFKSNGIPEEEFESLFGQLQQVYTEDRISYFTKRNMAIWFGSIVLFVLTGWFFYSYAPKTSMRNNPFWTAILGSGLLIFFLYLIIGFFKNWQVDYIKSVIEKKNDFNVRLDFFPFFLILGVIPYFIFNGKYKDEIENQIVQNGIETEAKVINGWSKEIRARRGKIEEYYILVEFKDKNGKRLEASKEVYKNRYSSYFKGQKIMIVYDSLNPSKVEFLDNAKAIKKFTDTDEKTLSTNDLFELIEMSDSEKILSKLNHISQGWKITNDGFINERRIEKIDLTDGAVSYASRGSTFDSAIKPFENGNYEKLDSEQSKDPFSKANLYENENYLVEVRQKPVTDKKNYDTYIFIVISIIKK